MCYDYRQLTSDIGLIRENYDFIDCTSIGKSVMGRDIHCLKIGIGRRRIMAAGAFHGLEYITSAFLIKFVEDYILNFITGKSFFDRRASRLFSENTLYVLPMINPDGADVAIHGLDPTEHRHLIGMSGIHRFKGGWQANANGVDLNHNYNANWSAIAPSPCPSKYGGGYPESEPETKAVTSFVRRTDFDTLLAFHSQGGEIYYDFDGRCGPKSERLAEKMAAESGYKVCKPTGTAAFGGCKDWFINEFGRDGFTIELGHGENPLPMSALDEHYEPCARILLCAMDG